jgi:metal-responsive CopG/Arc/MetJ family transcriptional regulator
MTAKVTISMPDKMLEQLDEMATRKRCSRSNLSTQAVRKLLDEEFIALGMRRS